MHDFTMPGPLAEPQPKRSILDKVLERLYPSGAYGGFLAPEALADERRMALRRAGLSLMASGGPRPQGTRNFGADLAAALDPAAWDQRLASVAQTGMQLSAMQKKLQDEEKADAILSQFPARKGETPEQQESRYRQLADAFMQAGLPEHAQVAAKLISEIRPADLKEGPGGVLYKGPTGEVVGQLPEAAKTIEGSQLWANGVARLAPWEKVRGTVEQYNQFRMAPLTPITSQALVSAAQELLNTHGALATSEPDMKAIEHLPIVGQLAKLLKAFSGGEPLTEEQRKDLVKATDQVVTRLEQEAKRVRSDVERMLSAPTRGGKPRFTPDEIMQLLPASPAWKVRGASGVAAEIDRNTP